jgi:hypothetical protein
MSAMSNLAVEIDDMLVKGYLPVTIARLLDVPINWVYEVADPSEDPVNLDQEDCSPFATVNS